MIEFNNSFPNFSSDEKSIKVIYPKKNDMDLNIFEKSSSKYTLVTERDNQTLQILILRREKQYEDQQRLSLEHVIQEVKEDVSSSNDQQQNQKQLEIQGLQTGNVQLVEQFIENNNVENIQEDQQNNLVIDELKVTPIGISAKKVEVTGCCFLI